MAPAPTVVVHGRAHLRMVWRAALGRSEPIIARTAPGAAAYAGALYLSKAMQAARAEIGPAPVRVVLDCDDDAALALGALRTGWEEIAFAGSATVRAKIADIAGQRGAAVVETLPIPDLDLGVAAQPERALAELLDRARP
ncbi:MAG: hypothetical protein QF926_04820 [Alphaproteobacteria bacterium]|nr:hypothetical protein [Alphaproteobacteria bacterium]MDP6515933.1 hypothetical protein [Alphaproteobacteria bacterium]